MRVFLKPWKMELKDTFIGADMWYSRLSLCLDTGTPFQGSHVRLSDLFPFQLPVDAPGRVLRAQTPT